MFHDDQHGTAIIAAAALLNALEITGKKASKVRVVFSGAGASAISTAEHFVRMGVARDHLIFVDREGVIHAGREDGMNEYKARFAVDTDLRTLAEAVKGADVLVGLSARGLVTKDMVASMAERPIVFALANPDPEITPQEVAEVRDDAIMATGRSDYPNQVNNVLGFPFLFRGALDVRARAINHEMMSAATKALAELAKAAVSQSVAAAYGGEVFEFGPEYLIPKPFDPRVLLYVAPAVAKAAMDSGCRARKHRRGAVRGSAQGEPGPRRRGDAGLDRTGSQASDEGGPDGWLQRTSDPSSPGDRGRGASPCPCSSDAKTKSMRSSNYTASISGAWRSSTRP